MGIDPDSAEGLFWAPLAGLDGSSPWVVRITFTVSADGVAATGVELRSTDGSPVTSKTWQRVRVGYLIDEARRRMHWITPDLPAARGGLPSGPRRGRPRDYPDVFYRRVADIYNTASRGGRRPLREVKKEFEGKESPANGQPFVGLGERRDKRAQGWVRTAKALGYITDESGERPEAD